LADVAPEQIDREAGRLAGMIAVQIAPETWGAVEAGAQIPVVGPAAPGMMMGGAAGMGGGAAPMASAPGMPGGIPGIVHLGGPGAISVFHRQLIVRNSIKVQDQVDRFLRMLAEGKALVK
jgi:hypothetical protein